MGWVLYVKVVYIFMHSDLMMPHTPPPSANTRLTAKSQSRKNSTAEENQPVIDICRRLENKLDKVIGQLENLESRLAKVEQLQLSQSTKMELNVTRIMQVEREQSTQADSLNFLHGMVDDMKRELGQLKSKTSD